MSGGLLVSVGSGEQREHGLPFGLVNSQLERARRPLPCGSSMPEDEVKGDVGLPGRLRLPGLSMQMKAFKGR